ncbi:hypothetical protein GGR56DRAFT_2178 [Xylariaceae sp. FL0804]|nr:hypothetical protein GGR56DRAFT_2178 [Xylariaceae sp. FL0804]
MSTERTGKTHPEPWVLDTELCFDTMKILQRHRHRCLTAQHLGDLGITWITCSALDITTGEPADGGQVFIRPLPLSEMRAIDDQHQLRQYDHLSSFHDDSMSNHPKMYWHESRFVNMFFEALLTKSGEVEPQELLASYPWTIRLPDPDTQLYRLDRKDQWLVLSKIEVLRGCRPHLICFLAQLHPLMDNALSLAEVWSFLALTIHRYYDRGGLFRPHRRIPVTLISSCARQVRIVQGWVDGSQGTINLRKTPILNLESSETHWAECLQILSWFMGDPVRQRYGIAVGSKVTSRADPPGADGTD